MKRNNNRTIYRLLAAALLAALVLGSQAGPTTTRAQSGGAYDLTWNVIAGGGATFSTGGSYSLGGTIGQHAAGVQSGGAYVLVGGFWAGAGGPEHNFYLPVIVR